MKKIVLVGLSSLILTIHINAQINYDFSYAIDFKKSEKIEIQNPKPAIDIPLSRTSSETQNPYLYLPIFKKMRYEYSYQSTNFVGKRKIVVEYKEYSEKEFQTKVTLTYFNKKDTKTIEYFLKITEKGILATDSILGGERLEIPIPLFKDKRWTENDKENRVIGFSSKAETPYGTLQNCLKILTNIKGAEVGKRERYYAPNIGLVKEIIKFEDKTDIIELERFEELK